MTMISDNQRLQRAEPPKMPFSIVALAPNDWRGDWMNRQQLLSRLGRDVGIAYSTGPDTVWGLSANRLKEHFAYPRQTMLNNVLVDNFPIIPFRWPGREFIDGAMRRKTGKRVSNLFDALPCSKVRILYIFHPIYADLIDDIDHDLLVYHAYDLFSSVPNWDSRMADLETSLVTCADTVIASSVPIARVLRERSPEKLVHVIPNGADTIAVLSASNKAPADLATIPHPRVGYVGRINRKVDFGLISILSKLRRDWSFVLVGPVRQLDDSQIGLLKELRNQPNVYFLGHKPRDELYSYMKNLDIGLLCYDTENSWAKYGYPLKLHEYLAAGLPVISSDLEAMSEFEDVVTICSTHQDWADAIAADLDNDDLEKQNQRLEVAKANDWEMCSQSLKRILISAVAQIQDASNESR